MRYSEIETFLAIIEHKSLSQAADSLFVAQSTVSQRLRRLEEEIGCPLITRSQGINNIMLTPKGKQFRAVAEQMISIWQEAESMAKVPTYHTLSVGAIESVTTVILPRLFNSILSADSNLLLSAYTSHSPTLYNMVEHRELDVAIVVRKIDLPTISITPILTERMVLVCTEGFFPAGAINLSQLDIHKEIFSSWGMEFREWHKVALGADSHPLAEVDSMNLFVQLSRSQECWFICPYSIAKFCIENHKMDLHELNFQPPNRTMYLIQRSSPSAESRKGIEVFHRCFDLMRNDFF